MISIGWKKNEDIPIEKLSGRVIDNSQVKQVHFQSSKEFSFEEDLPLKTTMITYTDTTKGKQQTIL